MAWFLDRKVIALIQDRIGANRAPSYGSPAAASSTRWSPTRSSFLLNEDVVPAGATVCCTPCAVPRGRAVCCHVRGGALRSVL